MRSLLHELPFNIPNASQAQCKNEVSPSLLFPDTEYGLDTITMTEIIEWTA